eukprot:g38453.t1
MLVVVPLLYQAEIQSLTERLEIEKQAWEENYMKKQMLPDLLSFTSNFLFLIYSNRSSFGSYLLFLRHFDYLEAWLLTHERGLKEEVRKGRDKEIELVIQRLEEEVRVSKQECERVAEN